MKAPNTRHSIYAPSFILLLKNFLNLCTTIQRKLALLKQGPRDLTDPITPSFPTRKPSASYYFPLWGHRQAGEGKQFAV